MRISTVLYKCISNDGFYVGSVQNWSILDRVSMPNRNEASYASAKNDLGNLNHLGSRGVYRHMRSSNGQLPFSFVWLSVQQQQLAPVEDSFDAIRHDQLDNPSKLVQRRTILSSTFCGLNGVFLDSLVQLRNDKNNSDENPTSLRYCGNEHPASKYR